MLYSRAGSYPPRAPMSYAEDFSPNTRQSACAEPTAWVGCSRSANRTLVPDRSLTTPQRAVAGWPTAWQGQNLRDVLITLGHDVNMPWQNMPKKDRDWILFTDEQPTVPVYARLQLGRNTRRLRSGEQGDEDDDRDGYAQKKQQQ